MVFGSYEVEDKECNGSRRTTCMVERVKQGVILSRTKIQPCSLMEGQIQQDLVGE